MAETGPTSQIAERLSEELFDEFLWTKCGPINHDWACVNQEKHDASTHPTDVVFAYDEPYSKRRTFLQCDLKSYAKGSITKASIRKAVISLARQVECAAVSEDWQKMHTSGDTSFDVCGLLFVYNHDGEFDRDFSKIVNEIKSEPLDIPQRSRIYVLGPENIYWLDNVRLTIQLMRGTSGSGSLPGRENCSFYYPQLSRKANVQNLDARAATMEMLTSPWITLRYRVSHEGMDRYVVFVRRRASSPEEYEYLIDYLRHYQCLQTEGAVTIRTLPENADDAVTWGQAVDRYIRNVVSGNSDASLAKIVRSISFRPMEQVKSNFSKIAIGME